MTETQISTNVQTIIDNLSLSDDRVGITRLQLNELLTEGILIELDIKGEGMFTKPANWAELGVYADDARASRLTRGSKYLIAESRLKALRSVISRMRQTLEQCTADVSGFRPWRYLHYKRHAEFIARWKSLLVLFEEVKQDILDNYEADYNQILVDWIAIAEEAWAAFRAVKPDGLVVISGVSCETYSEFRNLLASTAAGLMPTRAAIIDGLRASYRVNVLQGVDQIAAMNARAEQIKAKEQEAYLQAAILQNQYDHENKLQQEAERHLVEMNELVEVERRYQIEAMIHVEAEHIRTQMLETISPIEEMFTRLRRDMAEVCTEAAESIKKNGALRGRVAQRLRGLVDFCQATSIQDDVKLLKKLSDLRDTIGPAGEPSTATGDILTALSGVVDLVASAREDLLSGPSRFSMID